MQYLLDKDELDQFEKDYNEMKDKLENKLLDVCKLVADNYKIKFPHCENEFVNGCILTGGDGYCNDCKVVSQCPHRYKRYAK